MAADEGVGFLESPPRPAHPTAKRCRFGLIHYEDQPRNDFFTEASTRHSRGRQARSNAQPLQPPAGQEVEESEPGEESWEDIDHLEPGAGPRSRQNATLEADKAWQELLPELQRGYVQQRPAEQQLEQQLAAAQEGIYKATVEAFAASSCASCGHAQLQHEYNVPVRIIDIPSRIKLDVPVVRCSNPECRCITAIKPLQLCCWPSNADKSYDLTKAAPGEQQTWFTLRLMSHADLTSMIVRRAPMYRYAMLLEAHAAHCGADMAIERLDLLLGNALLQYQYVVCWLALLVNLGVGVQPDTLADCAGCWRQALSPAGIHSVYIDFCFKLVHLAKCTWVWGYQEAPNRRYYLPQEDVRAFQSSPSSMEKVEANKDCSDFKAAEVLARRSGKNDVTAVGAVTCRHGMPIKLMDIETGERYCYATLFLYHLLQQCAWLVRYVWYDINCKYAVHFMAWVSKQAGELRVALDAALAKVMPKFPLPVFHQYAHSTTCQRNHGSLRTEGAGLGHGEPTEALWSVLGEHGHTTQYMHPHRRRGRLERATLHVAEGVAARHPETLEGMAQRALQKRSEAIANIRATVHSLQLDGALEEAAMDQQVEALLLEFRASSGAAGAATSTKPWEVEWTELRLKVHYIQSDQSAELPGISLTFDDKVFQTAAAKLPSLQRHLQALERRNVPPEMSMPQVGTPEFGPYLDKYVAYEVDRLQRVLRSLSIDYLGLNRLFTKLASKRQMQKSIRASMGRVEQGMAKHLQLLQELLSKGLQRLPPATQVVTAGYSNWTVADLKAGRLFAVLPQAPGSGSSVAAASSAAGSSKLLLLERLDFHVLEFSRAQEEVQQVMTEMADSLEWYRQREAAITSRLQQLRPSTSVPANPEATAAQQGSGGSVCMPLQACSFEQGAAWYMERQLRRVQQVHSRAQALFAPVLAVQGVQLSTAMTVAELEEAEQRQRQATEQQQQQRQQEEEQGAPLEADGGEGVSGMYEGSDTDDEEAMAFG